MEVSSWIDGDVELFEYGFYETKIKGKAYILSSQMEVMLGFRSDLYYRKITRIRTKGYP